MAPHGGRGGQASTNLAQKPRLKRLRRSKNSPGTSTGTGNYYGVLGNDVEESELDSQDEMDATEAPKKVKRTAAPKLPPPITVSGLSISQLRSSIVTVPGVKAGEIRYKITQNGIKILSPDSTTFDKIKRHCTDNNIHGFSHTPPDERNVKVCLYGLWSMKTTELMNELNSVGIQPLEVKQLTIKSPRYNDQAIYLLYFQRRQHISIEKLRETKGLFNVIVSWKYYKNKSTEPTQCKTCLQYGHGKRNCFRPQVCFRCSGNHEGASCPFIIRPLEEHAKPKIAVELLRCAVCKKSGHTAASRECEARAKYKQQQQLLRQRQQQQQQRLQQQKHSTPKLNNVNFPPPPRITTHPLQTSFHVYTPFNSNPGPSSSAWVSRGTSNDLLSTDECLEIFDHFVTELLKCRSKEEQIRTIAKLSLEQVSKHLSPNRHHDSR